jgi:hypothetical protein
MNELDPFFVVVVVGQSRNEKKKKNERRKHIFTCMFDLRNDLNVVVLFVVIYF